MLKKGHFSICKWIKENNTSTPKTNLPLEREKTKRVK